MGGARATAQDSARWMMTRTLPRNTGTVRHVQHTVTSTNSARCAALDDVPGPHTKSNSSTSTAQTTGNTTANINKGRNPDTTKTSPGPPKKGRQGTPNDTVQRLGEDCASIGETLAQPQSCVSSLFMTPKLCSSQCMTPVTEVPKPGGNHHRRQYKGQRNNSTPPNSTTTELGRKPGTDKLPVTHVVFIPDAVLQAHAVRNLP